MPDTGHIWLNPADDVLYGRDTDDDEWVAIGQVTPTLAEVLAQGNEANDLPIVGADSGNGNTGASLAVKAASDGSATAQIVATAGTWFATGDTGAGFGINPGFSNRGGIAEIDGGAGSADNPGGDVYLYAGTGDATADAGAYLELYGGDGAGADGKASLSTAGSTGPGPLVSDGTYLTYSRAAFVANGSTVDQLRDSLIAAGLMDPAP